MKNPLPNADKNLCSLFIKAMIDAGYAPSAAAQLWFEANPFGSYGLFMAGKEIQPLSNK